MRLSNALQATFYLGIYLYGKTDYSDIHFSRVAIYSEKEEKDKDIQMKNWNIQKVIGNGQINE